MNMRWIRWLLVLPSAMAGWYAAFAIGLAMLLSADNLCPPEKVISGLCTAAWYQPLTKSLVCFGAALSAALSLFFAYAIAPSHKSLIVGTTLVVGSALAVWLGVLGSLWWELGCTLGAAAIVALVLHRRAQRASDLPTQGDTPTSTNV